MSPHYPPQKVPSLVPEPALINASFLGTLAGPQFFLRPYIVPGAGGIATAAPLLLINDASVGQPSLRASNGVLYVLDEPPVTPLMVLADSTAPAWADPRFDGLCTDLLHAVQTACAREMCGYCQTSICASASAVGCQFKAVGSAGNETFRDATTGTFAVCRRACPAPEAALSALVNQTLLNATFLDIARQAPGIFPFYQDQSAAEGAFTSVLNSTATDLGQVGGSGSGSGSAAAGAQLPPCDPGCQDEAPPSDYNYTCGQQAAWGKCRAVWMVQGGWCVKTCRGCYAGCRSLPLGAQCTRSPSPSPTANATATERAVPCGPGLACVGVGSSGQGECAADAPTVSTPAAAAGAGTGELSIASVQGAAVGPALEGGEREVMAPDGTAVVEEESLEEARSGPSPASPAAEETDTYILRTTSPGPGPTAATESTSPAPRLYA